MNKLLYITLGVFVFVGLFADFIANDRPILCKDNSGYRVPVFEKSFNNNLDSKCEIIINPLIKYSHNNIDKKNSGYISPFAIQNLNKDQQRHFLGTDQLGRDVLAGIIHGTAIAFKVGLASMLLAFILGLLMSLYPSYYGDKGYRRKIATVIFYSILFLLIIYYLSYFTILTSIITATYVQIFIFFITLLISLFVLLILLNIIPAFRKKITVPLDSIFTIITKLFQSLPGKFIILILISLFAVPSVYNIIIIIGILQWPVIARYIRAEMLKIKEEKFIEASKALGLSDRIIIWRHALPHALTSVIVALSFGFAGTILLESTLSFLGIGIPADHVSWGSLLSDARHNHSAWWLAVFPGFAIFITILIFRSIGNMILKKIGR